jgi:UDP-N-acetylmuramate--alanine ligase
VLHNLGFTVQGSDNAESANTKRLADLGIKILIGQKAENVQGVGVVVKSTAVSYENPEIVAARGAHIPVVRRSEMLAELTRLKLTIAIAGTHGKTTTTSMVATLLSEAKLDPTVINGGIINAYGTNAYLGKSEWMVVEADESDGTFNKIPASVAVVTNIEPEHLDFYGDFKAVKEAFKTFVSNIPFYGFAVMCLDHPEVQNLIGRVMDRRIITYGTNPQAAVRAVNIVPDETGTKFDVEGMIEISGVHIPIPGKHNVLNALAAISVAHELGVDGAIIKRAFAKFAGVKRRFSRVGEANGVSIIDDYAHHPTEIAATLAAARQASSVKKGRVIAVVQPHRYSRVHDLFEDFCKCFNDADMVVVLDIYSAGEQPIEGVDKENLADGIKAYSHNNVVALGEDALAKTIAGYAKAGDMVVCMGAGSITYMAADLAVKLEKAQAA